MKSRDGRVAAVRLCAAMVVGVWLMLGLRGWAIEWPVERVAWWCRASGYVAMGFLLASLMMTPLVRLAQRMRLQWVNRSVGLAMRRSLGMTAAWMGLLHAALIWTLYVGEAPWFVPLLQPFSRAGVAALGILVVLLVTSYPAVVSRLRIRYWKQLHWLAYVAALAVFWHVLLSPLASPVVTVGICLAFIVIRVSSIFSGLARR